MRDDYIIQRFIANTPPLLLIYVRKRKWVKTWPGRLSVSPGPACLGCQQHYLQMVLLGYVFHSPALQPLESRGSQGIWGCLEYLTSFVYDILSFWNTFLPSLLPHLLVQLAFSNLLFQLLPDGTLSLYSTTLIIPYCSSQSNSTKNILVQQIHSDYTQCRNSVAGAKILSQILGFSVYLYKLIGFVNR